MNSTEDTEITLGMGRMLGLFFSLIALCAIFFGMGYKMGRSGSAAAAGDQMAVTQTNGGPRPSAVRTPPATSDEKPSKDAAGTDEQPATPPQKSDSSAASSTSAPAASPSSGPVETVFSTAANYFVQVAAVSKHEDADALVDALKRKQYVALATAGPADKLYHVQVGPFSDIKDAEAMRTRLMNDGYNPILKK